MIGKSKQWLCKYLDTSKLCEYNAKSNHINANDAIDMSESSEISKEIRVENPTKI